MTDLKIGGATPAGSTAITKTGAWRTFVPRLHQEKCSKCTLCELYCPEGAVQRKGDVYEIDLDYCKGCGVCAHECPRKAIDMVLEEK